MARRAKSLKVEVGYAHRDHRSKKGRCPYNHPVAKKMRVNFKKKIDEYKLQELENEREHWRHDEGYE